MFVLLAGLSALLILPLLLWCVPETLQHKVMQRLNHQQPAVALKVAEAATILEQVCVHACVARERQCRQTGYSKVKQSKPPPLCCVYLCV